MPPQVLHVAGQVGEQHLNLVAPLGLQEEALVVAAGEKEQSLSRLGWSSSDPVSFLPLLLHGAWMCLATLPRFIPPSSGPAPLCPWPFRHPGTEPPPRPAPPWLQAHDRKKLALLLEVLIN